MPRGEQIAKPTERKHALGRSFFCGASPLTTSAPPIHYLTEAALVGAVALAFSCRDQSTPTAVAVTTQAPHAGHIMASVASVMLDPFTYRAPLDPYKIQQLPDFMIHSAARTDIVLQRLVFAPGAGPWHTHPGPSFVYVIEGDIRLDRVTEKGDCEATAVSGAGQAYFEVANQVHRAVVVSTQPAVLLVTRFNIPVGGAIRYLLPILDSDPRATTPNSGDG